MPQEWIYHDEEFTKRREVFGGAYLIGGRSRESH
jgi:hypothetical protein